MSDDLQNDNDELDPDALPNDDDEEEAVPGKIIDPEEDHESLDALADEEEDEIDMDDEEADSF